MNDYVKVVTWLFGPEGSHEEKRVLWDGRVMVVIGWLVDLNYNVWREIGRAHV